MNFHLKHFIKIYNTLVVKSIMTKNHNIIKFPSNINYKKNKYIKIRDEIESLLFNDIRGFFIFLGLLLNDCLNTAYNYITGRKDNEACAVVRNMYSTDEYLVLPTTHTEYITFVTAFLMTSMFFKQVFNFIKIIIQIFSHTNYLRSLAWKNY